MKKTVFFPFVMLLGVFLAGAEFLDVQRDLGLKGDGSAADAALLQKTLMQGHLKLYFSRGTYRFGTLHVAGGTMLKFDRQAKIVPEPKRITFCPPRLKKNYGEGGVRPLFIVDGDDVTFDGLTLDQESYAGPRFQTAVVYGRDRRNLVFTNWKMTAPSKTVDRKGVKARVVEPVAGVYLDNCENVRFTRNHLENIRDGLYCIYTRNVVSAWNTAFFCDQIVHFNFASSGLRHVGNWSRGTANQVRFIGGWPSGNLRSETKKSWVQSPIPWGSSGVILRDLEVGITPEKLQEYLQKEGYSIKLDGDSHVLNLHGVYDIQIIGNYAEYGNTLAWGNRAKQVLYSGNVTRFMNDYSCGVEGCDTVVFNNNISVNSATFALMSLYFQENLQVTGNVVIVRHEPYNPEWSCGQIGRPASFYLGHFLRFHHGPVSAREVKEGSRYGAGTVNVSGNLFINELEDRPSAILFESGRDVRFSDNKIVNGVLKQSPERLYLKKGVADHFNEFLSGKGAAGTGVSVVERQGRDLSRVTITGNEFISRQPGNKPQVMIEGRNAFAAVRHNVIRREPAITHFNARTREAEKGTPRSVVVTEQRPGGERDMSCARPATAVLARRQGAERLFIQNNLVTGWQQSFLLADVSPLTTGGIVFTGNTYDGIMTYQSGNRLKPASAWIDRFNVTLSR